MPNNTGLDISITASGQFPGEGAFIALVNAYIRTRETMEPATRNEWDKIILDDYKQWRDFWRGAFDALKKLGGN